MADNAVSKQREYWVDFIKGTVIFLVVLGHCGIPGFLLYPIYMFHMPVFFAISGYLYDDNGQSLTSFLKRKARSLLYPYFVLGGLIIVYNTVVAVITGHNSSMEVWKRIAALVYGNYIWENNVSYIGVLWLIVALFCSEILYYVVMNLPGKRRNAYVVLIAALGTTLPILYMYQKIRLPWCLDVACISFLYFFVGTWVRNHETSAMKSFCQIIIGFAVGVCNFLLMKFFDFVMLRVDMLSMNYGILPLFLISSSLISMGLMGLGRTLYMIL